MISIIYIWWGKTKGKLSLILLVISDGYRYIINMSISKSNGEDYYTKIIDSYITC